MTPDPKFSKLLLFTNGLVPLAMLLWDAAHKSLGANPVEFATRTTGMLTLVFLLLSLAVTPARKLTGWQWLGKHRRMIGLFAFFYGFLHLVTYVWFDKSFGVKAVGQDVWNRPFIAVGMAAFLIMVPLAVTSTNKMVKRLGGRRWNRLHKTAYLAAALGALHFYMLVKADTRLPLTLAAVLGVLLGYRLFIKYIEPKPPARLLAPPR